VQIIYHNIIVLTCAWQRHQNSDNITRSNRLSRFRSIYEVGSASQR